MSTRVGTIASYRRLPVSRSGNPHYEVTLTDGTVLRTEPDGAVNYDIENWAEARPGPARVRFTIERGQIVGGVELTPRGDRPTIYVISRDGKLVDQTEEPYYWFHQRHSFSMAHALQYEGYSIEGPFTEQDLADAEMLSHRSAEPLDDCNCSHATVQAHPARLCTWDRAENRAE
jgi:hypothetical protein